MIVIGVILLVAWGIFLFLGEIRFMNLRINRKESPQRYWMIQACVLALGLFCIWVQLPAFLEALG